MKHFRIRADFAARGKAVAEDQGLTFSSWVAKVCIESIRAHEMKQARRQRELEELEDPLKRLNAGVKQTADD